MKKKSIAIVGTRGIPACYGGFETFAEALAKRLGMQGYEVIVYCEPTATPMFEYEGVRLKYSKYFKSRTPLLYYFDCIRQATQSSDVLLVAGTGGVLFYGMPKFFKKLIITNIDGVESRRGKWSAFQQFLIKTTEFVAIKISDKIVADSWAIKQYILNEYKVAENRVAVIEYGAAPNQGMGGDSILEKYQITPNGYYLVVSRLEPENNILEIIDGYSGSQTTKPLIIIGGLRATSYSERVKVTANQLAGRVYLIGAIYDRLELDTLRLQCFAYLHGHSVGGTNPSLLEALSASNICICHDNVFNREVTENQMYYFKDATDLGFLINQIEELSQATIAEKKRFALNRISDYYNWERITTEYRALISSLS